MSFAYLPIYTGDYLRTTRHLSPAEHGCFVLLLMHCWDTQGPIPVDERRSSAIINARGGDEIEAMRRVLQEFFIRMDDGWYNKRLVEEIERWNAISDKRSDAARKRWEARKTLISIHEQSKSNANAEQMLSICTASSPSPSLTQIQNKDKDAALADANADVWSFGIDLLTRESGLAKATARSYIGALLKSWSEATVLDALMAASGKGDPKAYARKWLEDKPRRGQKKRSAAEELMEEINERK